jgi:hypothetical protein
MGISIDLKNVTVDGEWIEGDVTLDVDEGGVKFSKTQHFKTKKDVEQAYDLGAGFTLHAKASLEPPNNVCMAGRISNGPFGFDVPKRCFAI